MVIKLYQTQNRRATFSETIIASFWRHDQNVPTEANNS